MLADVFLWHLVRALLVRASCWAYSFGVTLGIKLSWMQNDTEVAAHAQLYAQQLFVNSAMRFP